MSSTEEASKARERTIDIRPLTSAIGAEIFGVDLARDLPEAMIREIRRALLDHLVIFFRDQDLTPEHLIAFSRRFGEITYYPFVEGMADYPEIVEVIKEKDERINFGGVWHTDTSYLEEPPMGSILYAVEVPPFGGDTLFANMYLAYEAMSEGMRRMLDPLIGVNSGEKPDAAVTRVHRIADRPRDAANVTTTAEHAIIRTHPETGRKALYISRAHTIRFKNMTVEESAPLLTYLFEHQTRPEFGCRFRWYPGSVAFWDNRAAQHNAINDYHGYRRVMRRVTLAGDRPR